MVIPWSDPVVVASLVWLTWLIVVVLFHGFYRPAGQGRKVAYMTIGSFLFLSVVLSIIRWLPSQHTEDLSAAAATTRVLETGVEGSGLSGQGSRPIVNSAARRPLRRRGV